MTPLHDHQKYSLQHKIMLIQHKKLVICLVSLMYCYIVKTFLCLSLAVDILLKKVVCCLETKGDFGSPFGH